MYQQLIYHHYFFPEVCYASDLLNFEVLFEISGFYIINEF